MTPDRIPMAGIDWGLKVNDGVNAVLKCLIAQFDVAGRDTAGALNTTIAAHPVGVNLPPYALIVGGFMDVNTVVTGAGASLAVSVVSANDIQTAAAISGAPWSTIGRKAIVPKANTPESTSIKLAATPLPVVFTVSAAVLTAGKVTCYLYYLDGFVSA
jgi:hypothetical protein